jgi:hypothetical protein
MMLAYSRRHPRAVRMPAMAVSVAAWSAAPYSVRRVRSSLARMPRCPVSIRLILERSQPMMRAASSSA